MNELLITHFRTTVDHIVDTFWSFVCLIGVLLQVIFLDLQTLLYPVALMSHE